MTLRDSGRCTRNSIAFCVCMFFLIWLPLNRSMATTAQAAYSSATSKNTANGHFVVEITSTSNVAIRCQVQYSGVSFLGADRSGSRTLLVLAVGTDGKPVVRSTEFGGFRTFTATVNCTAK